LAQTHYFAATGTDGRQLIFWRVKLRLPIQIVGTHQNTHHIQRTEMKILVLCATYQRSLYASMCK